MNLASQYALSLAAQLQAIAATSTVMSDPSLKTSLDELEQCTIGYGNLVEQVCSGFASFNNVSGSPTWDAMTYPVMLAGQHVLTNSASLVAAQLRALPVPRAAQARPHMGCRARQCDDFGARCCCRSILDRSRLSWHSSESRP